MGGRIVNHRRERTPATQAYELLGQVIAVWALSVPGFRDVFAGAFTARYFAAAARDLKWTPAQAIALLESAGAELAKAHIGASTQAKKPRSRKERTSRRRG